MTVLALAAHAALAQAIVLLTLAIAILPLFVGHYASFPITKAQFFGSSDKNRKQACAVPQLVPE